jgi:hypothetical protein
VRIPCEVYQFGWRRIKGKVATLEAMIPDLALAVPDGLMLSDKAGGRSSIGFYEYAEEMGLECRFVTHRFMARYTIPSGVSKWIDDREIGVILCPNVVEQVMLKIVFPDLI